MALTLPMTGIILLVLVNSIVAKILDAKTMVMMMMTMTMVMIENLEGGRNVAAWRVHVRPPVEHVVGAENQLGGK